MRAGQYRIRCPLCGAFFDSHEEYASHVFSKHPNSLWIRFRGEVFRE
ncbi:MAG: hypothetical protein N3F65_03560 [Nitrososphaeria archaeon]|nr:hypothetical protein [Nitrososphaeria archaeon]